MICQAGRDLDAVVRFNQAVAAAPQQEGRGRDLSLAFANRLHLGNTFFFRFAFPINKSLPTCFGIQSFAYPSWTQARIFKSQVLYPRGPRVVRSLHSERALIAFMF